jgi:antirestriction protein ArdC
VLREDNRAIIRAASAASKAADYLLAFRDDDTIRPAGSTDTHQLPPPSSAMRLAVQP